MKRRYTIPNGVGHIVQGQFAGIVLNCQPDGRPVQFVPKCLGPLPNGACEGDFAKQRPGDAILEYHEPIPAIVKQYHLGKRLGRGVTSIVYADAKKAGRVWKLTVDQPSYEVAKLMSENGNKHAVKVLADKGQVGMQGNLPVYLLAVERLIPLKDAERRRGSEASDLEAVISQQRGMNASLRARMIGKYLREERDENVLADYFFALGSALEKISGNAAIDLHTCNMMRRKSDGAIVMSDPVVDRDMVDVAISNRRKGLGQDADEDEDQESSYRPGTQTLAARKADEKQRAKERVAKEKRERAWARQEAAREKKGTMARKAFGRPLRPPHQRTVMTRLREPEESFTARIAKEAARLRYRAHEARIVPDEAEARGMREQARRMESQVAGQIAAAEGLMSPSHERWEVSQKIPRLPGMTRLTHEPRMAGIPPMPSHLQRMADVGRAEAREREREMAGSR